jgi:hypothetical protein
VPTSASVFPRNCTPDLCYLKHQSNHSATSAVRDEVYFLDQEYSCLYDDKVWKCIECYLNLPEASHPDQNPLNHAHFCELQQQEAGQTTAFYTSK